MSEPDAVPLPRDGAVFFDVRGEARSMRLSWYADSAVAVFSIWQGSRCTGTFRLPFGDLVRMVETLQSGPPSHAAHTTSREPGGAAFTGHREAYPETASHQVRGYADHPGFEAREPAEGSAHLGQNRYGDSYPATGARTASPAAQSGRGRDSGPATRGAHPYGVAPAHLAAERPPGRGDSPGYSDPSYPGPAYRDRYAAPLDYQDHQPAAGHSARPQGGPNPQRPADYRGAPDYRGTAEHHGAAEYMDQPGYRESGGYAAPGGYTNPGGYADPAGYTDPGGYTNPGGYQTSAEVADPGGYAAPAGYADPGGYSDQASYREHGAHRNPGEYSSRQGADTRTGAHTRQNPVSGAAVSSHEEARPFEAGPPAAEFSQPVGAAGWLAAPAAERPTGRHGAEHPVEGGIPGSRTVPRGDQSDSDWEAATAAYRAL
jgi:hypothetical protein